MAKVSNKFNAMIAGVRNLFANAKSAVARKAGYVMMGTVGLGSPMMLATSCEKECDENDPKSECYVQPPVQKHNAYVQFVRGDGGTPEERIAEVAAYKDSISVDTVFFVVSGDYSNISENGANNNMNNVFYPVFGLPMNGQIIWGKGNFNTDKFNDNAMQWLIAHGYTFNAEK